MKHNFPGLGALHIYGDAGDNFWHVTSAIYDGKVDEVWNGDHEEVSYQAVPVQIFAEALVDGVGGYVRSCEVRLVTPGSLTKHQINNALKKFELLIEQECEWMRKENLLP